MSKPDVTIRVMSNVLGQHWVARFDKDGYHVVSDVFDNHLAAERKAFELRALRQRAIRRERDQAMRDIGMVKVKGALGGTYWE